MPIKTKNNQKSTSKNLKRFAMPALLGLLFVTLAVNSYFVYNLYATRPEQDNSKIASLIVQAVSHVNRPLPIDAISGKAYVKAAGVSFGVPSKDLGELGYSFIQGGGIEDELHIANMPQVFTAESRVLNQTNDLQKLFAEVPRLHACARGVGIYFGNRPSDETTVNAGSKKLANGKTVYFSTEKECDSPKLLEYAKTIESY